MQIFLSIRQRCNQSTKQQQQSVAVNAWTLERSCRGGNPDSHCPLCDFGQVSGPLCASVSWEMGERNDTIVTGL